MAATPLEYQDLDGPGSVLAALESTQAQLNQNEIAKFRLAVEWAAAHPVTDLDDAATVDGTQGELRSPDRARRWWRSSASRTSHWRSG